MLVNFTVREIHEAARMCRFALLNQGALALVVLHKYWLISRFRAEDSPALGDVMCALKSEPDGLWAWLVGSLTVYVST